MNNNNLPTVDGIDLIDYVDESQLNDVMRLVGQDLSEPYSSEFLDESRSTALVHPAGVLST